MITKTTLLSVISIFSTYYWRLQLLIPTSKSIHVNPIVGLFTTMDLFTNFWCVILLFKTFNDYYIKICKCCDTKCKICWNRIVSDDKQAEDVHHAIASGLEIEKKQTIEEV